MIWCLMLDFGPMRFYFSSGATGDNAESTEQQHVLKLVFD